MLREAPAAMVNVDGAFSVVVFFPFLSVVVFFTLLVFTVTVISEPDVFSTSMVVLAQPTAKRRMAPAAMRDRFSFCMVFPRIALLARRYNYGKATVAPMVSGIKINLTEYYDLVYEYKNDCLIAGVEYKKRYYSNEDLKPSEDLFFSITLFPLTTYTSTNLFKEVINL